jgi:hypothetical protein
LHCNKTLLPNAITELEHAGVQAVNAGYELASFLKTLDNRKYIALEAYEYFMRLTGNKAASVPHMPRKVLALYNIGILNEPSLGLSPYKMIEEICKSYIVVLIWEHSLNEKQKLFWNSSSSLSIDLSDINPTIIEFTHEVQ